MCTPRTYYTIHLNRYNVLINCYMVSIGGSRNFKRGGFRKNWGSGGFTPGGVQGQRPARGSGGQRPPGREFINLRAYKVHFKKNYTFENIWLATSVYAKTFDTMINNFFKILLLIPKKYTCFVVDPLKK